MKCNTNTKDKDFMKFYGSATVGTKGQVVIPAGARDKFGITEGDKLLVMGLPMGNGVALIKATALDKMMQDVQRHVTEIQQIVNEHREGADE